MNWLPAWESFVRVVEGGSMAAAGQPETVFGDLCGERDVTRQTVYRHVSPKGELRPDGLKLLSRSSSWPGGEWLTAAIMHSPRMN